MSLCKICDTPLDKPRAQTCQPCQNQRRATTRREYRANTHGKCRHCGVTTERITSKVCSACLTVVRSHAAVQAPIPEGPPVCPNCKEEFTRRRENQRYCSQFCQYGRGKRVPENKTPIAKRVACARCVYGKPQPASEIGWECVESLAARCQPLGVAKCLRPRSMAQ